MEKRRNKLVQQCTLLLLLFAGNMAFGGLDMNISIDEIEFDYAETLDIDTICETGLTNDKDRSEYFAYYTTENYTNRGNGVFLKLKTDCNDNVTLIITSTITGNNSVGNVSEVFYETLIGTTKYLNLSGVLPSDYGKTEFWWTWTITAIPSCNTSQYDACTYTFTTHHCCYVLYDEPIAPMDEPWPKVLDIATSWANSEYADGIISTLTTNLYNSGVIYDSGEHYSPDNNDFKLKSLLEAWQFRNSTELYMDCRDFANFILVLATSLGIDCYHNFIDFKCNGQGAEYADINTLQPAGCEIRYAGTVSWNTHQVAWWNGSVVDASTKINISSSQINPILTLVDDGMDFTSYIGYLTSCTNFTTSVNKCNPVYQ